MSINRKWNVSISSLYCTGSTTPLGLVTTISRSPRPALNVSTVNLAGAPTLLPVGSRPATNYSQWRNGKQQYRFIIEFHSWTTQTTAASSIWSRTPRFSIFGTFSSLNFKMHATLNNQNTGNKQTAKEHFGENTELSISKQLTKIWAKEGDQSFQVKLESRQLNKVVVWSFFWNLTGFFYKFLQWVQTTY